MSDILKSLGIGAGAGIVNNALAGVNAMISFKRQKELMSMQNAANRANARDAAALQVEGLRMAGFNPAMVQGAGTAPAPTVSQGNADMPQTIPFDPNTALLLAEKDKIEEETRGVKQANDITDAANDAAVRGYLSDFNKEQDDLRAKLKTLPEGSEEWNKIDGRLKEIERIKERLIDPAYAGALGFVKGTEAAAENTKHRMDILGNYLKGTIDNAVAKKQLGNGAVDALARMPVLEKRKLSKDIDHVKQLIAESESKEELNDKMIEEISARIGEIGDRVLRARLNDENFVRFEAQNAVGETEEETKKLREMWKNNLENLTDTEFRKLKYDIGAGVIKGAATGGAIGGVNQLANKLMNGSKMPKDVKFEEYKARKQKDNGSTFYKEGLGDWTDNNAGEYNRGVGNFKF